ncbi:MAG: hypothetical protein COA42_22635 [Alteromonadaceae bacterium]|nr:MAG: hypothetical protein COA42_22635 [Alteromonadaceae bacterium]
MANGKVWQRRSDEWVEAIYQSRLRNEQHVEENALKEQGQEEEYLSHLAAEEQLKKHNPMSNPTLS